MWVQVYFQVMWVIVINLNNKITKPVLLYTVTKLCRQNIKTLNFVHHSTITNEKIWLLLTKPYCLLSNQKWQNSVSKMHWINCFCPELTVFSQVFTKNQHCSQPMKNKWYFLGIASIIFVTRKLQCVAPFWKLFVTQDSRQNIQLVK